MGASTALNGTEVSETEAFMSILNGFRDFLLKLVGERKSFGLSGSTLLFIAGVDIFLLSVPLVDDETELAVVVESSSSLLLCSSRLLGEGDLDTLGEFHGKRVKLENDSDTGRLLFSRPSMPARYDVSFITTVLDDLANLESVILGCGVLDAFSCSRIWFRFAFSNSVEDCFSGGFMLSDEPFLKSDRVLLKAAGRLLDLLLASASAEELKLLRCGGLAGFVSSGSAEDEVGGDTGDAGEEHDNPSSSAGRSGCGPEELVVEAGEIFGLYSDCRIENTRDELLRSSPMAGVAAMVERPRTQPDGPGSRSRSATPVQAVECFPAVV